MRSTVIVVCDAQDQPEAALAAVAGSQEQFVGEWAVQALGADVVAVGECEDFDSAQAVSSLGSQPWSERGRVRLLWRASTATHFSSTGI